MDKELRAAVKAMARHQLAMADALALLLEYPGVQHPDSAEELKEHSEELEGLMGNLTYE